ncbi:MAG: hypothetical protein RJB60_2659 [Pseudomonadota bacterium]|jgi:hypothetical protein
MKTRHALPFNWRLSGMARAALMSATLAAPCVHAQMADPMRPAFGNPANRPQAQAYVSPNLPMPSSAGQGVRQGPGAQAGGSPSGAPKAASGSPRLTSVMVGSPTVASAVIDGQVVRVGERLRGERGEVLVQVDRLGVLLRSSQGSTRLSLMSRIELPAVAMPKGAAAPEVAASSPNAPLANVTPLVDAPGVARKETP